MPLLHKNALICCKQMIVSQLRIVYISLKLNGDHISALNIPIATGAMSETRQIANCFYLIFNLIRDESMSHSEFFYANTHEFVILGRTEMIK